MINYLKMGSLFKSLVLERYFSVVDVILTEYDYCIKIKMNLNLIFQLKFIISFLLQI